MATRAYNLTKEMSERQEAYIRDLMGIHLLTPEQEAAANARLAHPLGDPDRLTMDKASAWIDRLKQLPRRPVEEQRKQSPTGYLTVEYIEVMSDADPLTEKKIGQLVGGTKPVPQGRYAIPNPNPATKDINDLAFYYLWVGDRYGWALYQKVGPEEYKVENRGLAAKIIRLIAEDPLTATQTYGRELGYCGMCGRELTNQTSREFGIGPICRERL